jgi:hypothetical protein
VEDGSTIKDNMKEEKMGWETFEIKARGKGRTLKDEQRQQCDDDPLAWR